MFVDVGNDLWEENGWEEEEVRIRYIVPIFLTAQQFLARLLSQKVVAKYIKRNSIQENPFFLDQ